MGLTCKRLVGEMSAGGTEEGILGRQGEPSEPSIGLIRGRTEGREELGVGRAQTLQLTAGIISARLMGVQESTYPISCRNGPA